MTATNVSGQRVFSHYPYGNGLPHVYEKPVKLESRVGAAPPRVPPLSSTELRSLQGRVAILPLRTLQPTPSSAFLGVEQGAATAPSRGLAVPIAALENSEDRAETFGSKALPTQPSIENACEAVLLRHNTACLSVINSKSAHRHFVDLQRNYRFGSRWEEGYWNTIYYKIVSSIHGHHHHEAVYESLIKLLKRKDMPTLSMILGLSTLLIQNTRNTQTDVLPTQPQKSLEHFRTLFEQFQTMAHPVSNKVYQSTLTLTSGRLALCAHTIIQRHAPLLDAESLRFLEQTIEDLAHQIPSLSESNPLYYPSSELMHSYWELLARRKDLPALNASIREHISMPREKDPAHPFGDSLRKGDILWLCKRLDLLNFESFQTSKETSEKLPGEWDVFCELKRALQNSIPKDVDSYRSVAFSRKRV